MNTYILVPKNSKKFVCKNCDYKTMRKSQYERHLMTSKHIKNENTDVKSSESSKCYIFQCKCGKSYKHSQSLYNHKKKCIYETYDNKIIENNNSSELKTMLLEVIQENKELQKTILNLVPQIGNNNTTNNNIHNIKQKFNINLFLNEKCKDAISMDKFIESIEVSMKNLLTTKDKGLSEGLSSIIIDNMNKLSLYERPMHCTDKKREIMYIKNKEWAKDDNQKNINDLLKKVENKQMKNIKIWMDNNPLFMENEKLQEEYIKLVRNSTSSINQCKGRAIKNVCDKVFLDKLID